MFKICDIKLEYIIGKSMSLLKKVKLENHLEFLELQNTVTKIANSRH